MYKITNYSKRQAKKFGVTIKPSHNKNKKIDVYKNDTFVTSIGATGYKDYPTYIKENGTKYATKRRKMYKVRHNKDINHKGFAGWYASKILW